MSDSSISISTNGNGSANNSRVSQSVTGGAQAAGSSGTSSDQAGKTSVAKENISKEKLNESAELLNKSAEILQKDIRFNVVPSENVIQAEILNTKTDEVIKKIPPDEMIELRKRIDAFIGLFVDEER